MCLCYMEASLQAQSVIVVTFRVANQPFVAVKAKLELGQGRPLDHRLVAPKQQCKK